MNKLKILFRQNRKTFLVLGIVFLLVFSSVLVYFIDNQRTFDSRGEASSFCTVEGTQILVGDVNNDGEINMSDAILVLRHIAGIIELTGDQLKAADVNADGEITVLDAQLIQRFIVGLIDQFPACPTSVAQLDLDCLESGTEKDIQRLLNGEGAKVELCPNSVFEISKRVEINARGQEIYTKGKPTDNTRATLRLASKDESVAIQMRDYDNVVLAHVIVDGNRVKLGQESNTSRRGQGLIWAGGYSKGQVVRYVDIREPRSFAALHIIQGHSDSQPCTGALIENNNIGPAGRYKENAWADGIALACKNTIVRNNTITDATDGGIVVFGAPGSRIENNLIQAVTRPLLGGINMVDYDPYDGDYTGTIVSNNIIDAKGDVIRIGLAMGTHPWWCARYTSETNRGATVENNTLRGKFMQYGFIVDGVDGWTVANNVSEATHSGIPSVGCHGKVASPPEAFMFNPDRSKGKFQNEFKRTYLDLALWAIPEPSL